jgi:CRP-like cAMP-binding protein
MRIDDQALAPLLDKMTRGGPLSEADRKAFLDLPFVVRPFEAGAAIVEEGCRSHSCAALLSGFAYRHRMLTNGSRQIISVHFPGDFPDLQSGLLGIASHSIRMLTPGQIATVQAADLRALAVQRPAIQAALWRETLIDMSICGEWVANVGRRDARARIAHLICEFAERLRAAGLLQGDTCQLPMTQEQIADATGLTTVHVNRTLQTMRREGLIKSGGRAIRVGNWKGLAIAGDFHPAYLHLADRIPTVDHREVERSNA